MFRVSSSQLWTCSKAKQIECSPCKGSTRRRVARLVLRHNGRHWQRIVFKRAMYPAWRGAACDWASDARWIAAEAVFSRSSKGLGEDSCCGYTGLAVYAPSQSQETTRYSTSRAEPTRARPLVRHLPSCAASCSQIVFSVPICWPSKWRHVTRRTARRLVPASKL
jgi:hypothetical protein